jgi:hypothetical protein
MLEVCHYAEPCAVGSHADLGRDQYEKKPLWGQMKHPIYAIVGAALLVAIGTASPARADKLICDESGPKNRWGKAVVGTYIVQNNLWNGNVPGSQCINVTDHGPGFAITKQTGSAPTDNGPASYPSIYVGCHYADDKSKCSPGTNLPIQVKSIKKAETSITLKYVGGAIFDASYDIWLDPKPITTGVNKQEIMIWLNRQGSIQPVGQAVENNVKIAGQNWQVWSGSNGANDVISYVVPSAIANMTFNVRDFIADIVKRGKITDDFYLTSIQAGFEPWRGGEGLAIESFRADVEAR